MACFQCEKDGFSPKQCGPKTLPGHGSVRQKRSATSAELHETNAELKQANCEFQRKVIFLEEKMDKMTSKLDQLLDALAGRPTDRMYVHLHTHLTARTASSTGETPQFLALSDLTVLGTPLGSGNDLELPLIDTPDSRPTAFLESSMNSVAPLAGPLSVDYPFPDFMLNAPSYFSELSIDQPQSNSQLVPMSTELIPRSPMPLSPILGTSTTLMNMERQALSHFLAKKTRPDMVPSLLNYLGQYPFSGTATDIWATMITPSATLLYRHSSWPLLAWKEPGNIDVYAIFKVRGDGAPCSVLFHYGIDKVWKDAPRGRKGWEEEVLGWEVVDIKDIEELVMASWHIAKRGTSPTGGRLEKEKQSGDSHAKKRAR